MNWSFAVPPVSDTASSGTSAFRPLAPCAAFRSLVTVTNETPVGGLIVWGTIAGTLLAGFQPIAFITVISLGVTGVGTPGVSNASNGLSATESAQSPKSPDGMVLNSPSLVTPPSGEK